MKMTFIFLFVLLFISSSIKAEENQNDIYEVINELLQKRFNDVQVVLIELKKIYIYNKYGKDFNGKDLKEPNDSSVYQNIYKRNFFSNLYKKRLITQSDVNFMFNQIDTLKTYDLDSSKIKRRTLRNSTIYPVFIQSKLTDSAYKFLEINYKAHSFIRFTTPITSKTKNKILISVYHFCGGLCGYGGTYLFEKKNGKWKIIFEKVDFLV